MYFHPFASKKRHVFSDRWKLRSLPTTGFQRSTCADGTTMCSTTAMGRDSRSRAEQVGSSRRIASRSHPAKSVIRSPSDRKIRLREREREQFRPLTVIVLATEVCLMFICCLRRDHVGDMLGLDSSSSPKVKVCKKPLQRPVVDFIEPQFLKHIAFTQFSRPIVKTSSL